MSSADTPELAAELLSIAVELAVAVGDRARDGRAAAAHGPDATTKSSPTDLVTEFDRASERSIVDGLRSARPLDGLVGEEGATTPSTSGITWLIDPIDGTTNFVYDLPMWAVSIAAADPVGGLVGVVYLPVLGELYTATRGGGAFCNGRPLRCGAVTDPAVALVATGFGYAPERRRAQSARLANLLHLVRDVRRMGAAAADLCFVAAGRLDAYFEEGLGPWDLAAGQLVAEEAGCRSGDFAGGPARPAEVLVANPALFESLAGIIRAASHADG
jgi:myo-inositol-1(or 4)-monophosphatase